VVLVGKGITFDSGGLAVKPNDAMVGMKTDMSGAAAVLAVLGACREVAVPVRVTGLLALAENALGGASYRPGDVVRQYGGRTVEVVNTDAEGRLVLADALAYADHVLRPDLIVDLATLTGAAGLGLGRRHAALFSTDDDLATALQQAGEATGERVWRLPLVEDYLPTLRSEVADLRHTPRAASKVGGGAITAALFLRQFVGRRPWAHLDIAGPARPDSEENEVAKATSGYGARLLLRFLESGDPLGQP
jgi:leucyl aminopeptidase